MKIKNLLIGFVTIFAVTLLVAAIVTYLWNVIGHGHSAVDWETSFRLAIILGIGLPVARAMTSRKKQNRDSKVATSHNTNLRPTSFAKMLRTLPSPETP